jgi:hypothetical protein
VTDEPRSKPVSIENRWRAIPTMVAVVSQAASADVLGALACAQAVRVLNIILSF